MVILGATCGNLGSYTLNNGFTEGIDQAVGASNGITGVTGHKSAKEPRNKRRRHGHYRQAIIDLGKGCEARPYSNCAR
jgi:hypothetical protein